MHRQQQVTVGLGFSREEQQNLGSGATPDVRLGRRCVTDGARAGEGPQSEGLLEVLLGGWQ